KSFVAFMGSLHMDYMINFCEGLENKFKILYLEFFSYSADQILIAIENSNRKRHGQDIEKLRGILERLDTNPTLKVNLRGVLKEADFESLYTTLFSSYQKKEVGFEEIRINEVRGISLLDYLNNG